MSARRIPNYGSLDQNVRRAMHVVQSDYQSQVDVLSGRVDGLIESDTYTPSLSGLAVGTGGSAANSGDYVFVGPAGSGSVGLLMLQGKLTFGTSGMSFPSSTSLVSLPSGFEAVHAYGADHHVGMVGLRLAATTGTTGPIWLHTATQLRLLVWDVASSYATPASLNSTRPGTWASGDSITWTAQLGAART